ncbi:MAG TPA: ATP-grasp domain-containing protein [Gemmataceae bacterium]
MLSAIVEDLGAIHGVEVSTLVAETTPSLRALPRSIHVTFSTAKEERQEAAFRELARRADATLVIAPEFDALLFDRCRAVEESGGRLLGSSSEAVRATADKRALARHWIARGVPTPATWPVGSESASYPAVLKPRFGAGSLATFQVAHADEIATCLMRGEQEGWREEMILQSYVRGQACSVAFLVGPAGCVALPPCRQHLSDDRRFRYFGGSLPLPSPLAERAVLLGRRALEHITGLRGYVGVDLVLGEALDGSDDVVIEINPRLTTSYVGLRALAESNLAEAMLRVVDDCSFPALRWRDGSVVFHPDGRAEWQACALER